jgi:hypothetical protein
MASRIIAGLAGYLIGTTQTGLPPFPKMPGSIPPLYEVITLKVINSGQEGKTYPDYHYEKEKKLFGMTVSKSNWA